MHMDWEGLEEERKKLSRVQVREDVRKLTHKRQIAWLLANKKVDYEVLEKASKENRSAAKKVKLSAQDKSKGKPVEKVTEDCTPAAIKKTEGADKSLPIEDLQTNDSEDLNNSIDEYA